MIDSKPKDLRGTAEQAAYRLRLYRCAELNNDFSLPAFRVPKNAMPFGNNRSKRNLG